MAKKKAKKVNGHAGMIWLEDSQLAALRMQAIQVAAHLPMERYTGYGQLGGSPVKEPGKSAAQVVADASTIMAFIGKKQGD